MSDLKFGLIGASYVAASRMVPAFHANGITPKGLFDTDKERFQFWREQDLDLLTPDLDELLGSNIDAVYISSRNDQHAPQAILAAEAGKHIIVEKPMALALAGPYYRGCHGSGRGRSRGKPSLTRKSAPRHRASTSRRRPNRHPLLSPDQPCSAAA
jgi:hypothetical protein